MALGQLLAFVSVNDCRNANNIMMGGTTKIDQSAKLFINEAKENEQKII